MLFLSEIFDVLQQKKFRLKYIHLKTNQNCSYQPRPHVINLHLSFISLLLSVIKSNDVKSFVCRNAEKVILIE